MYGRVLEECTEEVDVRGQEGYHCSTSGTSITTRRGIDAAMQFGSEASKVVWRSSDEEEP